jgi:protein gp37
MSDGTAIEWTDATWNPVTGCSVISAGCTNCYAMRLAGTRMKHTPSRAGLTVESKAGPVWNGQVRFNEDWLDQPLKWKNPRRVFVCAHGDLFHESVPDEWIDRVFGVMALAPQHTFQVLTKRPERMRDYIDRCSRLDENGYPAEDIRVFMSAWTQTPSWRRRNVTVARMIPPGRFCKSITWPLPNVWLGTSAEDARSYRARWGHVAATPAAVRFLSAEPLLGDLGDLDLGRVGAPEWVIVGGESGPGARPMHPDWARSIRDQCDAAAVPFFFKQHGEWLHEDQVRDGQHPCERFFNAQGQPVDLAPIDEDGVYTGRLWHWWKPDLHASIRIGKKRAGRKLDGRTHDEFPRGFHV